jgi:hypothetical protein
MTAPNADALLEDDIITNDAPTVPTGRFNRLILPTSNGSAKEYTHVTTVAKTLDDGFGIGVWRTGRVAWALAQRPDLVLRLAAVPMDDKDTINEVVAKAEIVAGNDEGSNLGTAYHNILARVDAGEDMTDVHPHFKTLIHNYLAELDRKGLNAVPELIERRVLCSRYGCAGTFDNGYTEYNGGYVLGDKKTANDPRRSELSIATQLATYVNSDAMMNYETGQFEAMPPFRTDYALVIRIDRETFEVNIDRIDIEVGWAAARVAMETRALRKVKGLMHPYIVGGDWVPKPAASLPPSPPLHPVSRDVIAGVVNSMTGVAATVGAMVDQAIATGDTGPEAMAELNGQAKAAVVTPRPHPGIDADVRVNEILEIRKNDKSRLQLWAGTLGCTDLAHHRKWLAEWIVTATPGSSAVEPPEASANGQGRHPRTKAEAGLDGPVPDQPPGQPVIDLTADQIIRDIASATNHDVLNSIYQRWTTTYGPGSWTGNVREAADRRAAELSSSLSSGSDGAPF